MIKWIKFKGSTEEERTKELEGKLPVIIYREGETFTIDKDDEDGPGYYDIGSEYWAPLNLPQEEKWERLADYYGPLGNQQTISETLLREFDNIYSILNELRKR